MNHFFSFHFFNYKYMIILFGINSLKQPHPAPHLIIFTCQKNHFTSEMSQSVIRKNTTWDKFPNLFQSSNLPQLAHGFNNESKRTAKFPSEFNKTEIHDYYQSFSGVFHDCYNLASAILIHLFKVRNFQKEPALNSGTETIVVCRTI